MSKKITYMEATFRVGEYIKVKRLGGALSIGKITSFYSPNHVVSFDDPPFHGSCSWERMRVLNSLGSQKIEKWRHDT